MDPQVLALQQQLADQQAALQQQQQQRALQVLLQAQQPAAGPFALTPAQACQDVIHLSSCSSGIKLHKQIIAPLTNLFDGAPHKMMTFLASISERANACNWTVTLLCISEDQGAMPRDLSLISQH
jgi:hypothetical protein